MTDIAAVGAAFSVDASVAKAPLGPTLDVVQPGTSQTAADSPATIVSISSASSTAKPQSLPDVNPDEVDRTLSALGSVNGFADILEHFDWAGLGKERGSSYAENQKNRLRGAIFGSTVNASVDLANNHVVPVHDFTSPDALKAGAAPTTITVSDFSFTHGGSTYSVRHLKNGLLNGTKDGQWWGTWQVTSPTSPSTPADAGAAAALQTLTSLAANSTNLSKRVDVTA